MPRISDLDALVAPNNDDELAIVDKAGVITKKIKRGDLLKGSPLPADTVDKDAIEDDAVTPEKRSGGIAKGSFTSAVGDYTVNNLNFRPTSVEFIATLTSSNNVSSLSTGFMIEGGGQECVAIASSASSPASTHSRSYDDRCISLLSYSGGSFGNFGIGTFVSMNDDGFTINMSSATLTNFTIKWIARR